MTARAARAAKTCSAATRWRSCPRVSRHLVSNLVVDATSARSAVASYVLLVYAKDGTGPQVAASYAAVCDVRDDVVLDGDRWLIERRELTSVFLAPDNDSVLLAPPVHAEPPIR